MKASEFKKLIKEELMKYLKENPTTAPSKPKTNPSPGTKPGTKPTNPPKRRPLTPPKTVPKTEPKAEGIMDKITDRFKQLKGGNKGMNEIAVNNGKVKVKPISNGEYQVLDLLGDGLRGNFNKGGIAGTNLKGTGDFTIHTTKDMAKQIINLLNGLHIPAKHEFSNMTHFVIIPKDKIQIVQ